MTISAAGLWAVSGWWGGLQQVTVVLSLPETGAEARRGEGLHNISRSDRYCDLRGAGPAFLD